jgi:chaperonin GroEL (HSP60 family)
MEPADDMRVFACTSIDVGADMFVATVLASNDPAFGYDVSKDLHVGDPLEDLYAAGVIDPVKVVKQELLNSASIAALMLTTEAVISDLETADPNETGLSSRQKAMQRNATRRLMQRQRRPIG